MVSQTIFGAMLLSAHALAAVDQVMVARSSNLDEQVRRDAYELLMEFDRRQASPTMPSTNINITQWNEMTAAACGTAVSALNGNAGNPSGLTACYNVPYLDQQTGVFESEVRLYNVSAASGDWAGLSIDGMSVAMSYPSAQVAATNETLVKREEDSLVIPAKRQSSSPSSIRTLTYVGQLDQSVSNLNATAMQQMLVPTIQLSAASSSGSQINTQLSSTQAAFVAGVFATQATATESTSSSTTSTAPSVPASVVAGLPQLVIADPEHTAYVIPGAQFRIKPIGLILTSIWLGLFVAACGGGAVLKAQSRTQYRTTVKAQQASGFARI